MDTLSTAYAAINAGGGGGGSKSFAVYLLAASSVAIYAAFFLSHSPSSGNKLSLSSRTVRVWPELELSWRSALATVIGFLGSAFGTVGGVGGGGIFVPMLNLIVGFDAKSAAALSKCMIMGASASSVWYNLRVAHPFKEVPIIDYNLALLFQPMLMLGITIGVELSVVFPYWLITVLIIILFIGTSSRSMCKAVEMWKQETLLKMEKQEHAKQSNQKQVEVDTKCEPLLPRPEKSTLEVLMFNVRWKGILLLALAWFAFLFLQILKSNSEACGLFYWVVNVLQFPVALSVFGWEAAKLWRESRERRRRGNWECVCEASIEWTATQLLFCAFCGLLGGTVGGLLGSGGGFILGPLFLEIGVIPQVASATATFVMMFSSSLSVVEFYFLKRFPIPYALYLIAVSVLAGFWGQFFVRRLVKMLKRASIIVFILSSVIFASAVTMGVVGTDKSISMMKHHEYMGFLSFCDK
ncbi:sulfite exporter TauE/SafE family protein 4-like [Zingiber officinale]|uniref:sulfite exporter TauE/SafE family protein 4-like n=1 Tax=Zingiber officinale TaxID=94328 RepID=UPI001C4CB738|nr:sulfite exporter TauE/SafE family protein 4-like [Zingiber officinale]